MPRKSSKTARVMNLLAGGEVNGEGVIDTKAAEPKPEQTANQVVETVRATSTAVTEAELKDMVNPPKLADDPDPLAEAIKNTLEQEMDALEQSKMPKVQEIEDLVQPEAEADYSYVNVMERIVGEQVSYFMEQFEVCSCDRCVADTKALALTNLPPKYIVTAKSTVAPLLNFYTNKFIGQVTVELTKACQTVKDVPHHGR